MKIIGISAFYHNSAVALIESGEIIYASEEERFTRLKNDDSFPFHALSSLLETCKIKIEDIDFFCFYDKPLIKFERILETYISYFPRGFFSFCKVMPLWITYKLFQRKLLIKNLKKFNKKVNYDSKLLFSEHHLSHAASAFYPSGFDESLILTIDGVGEWCTTSVMIGKGNSISIEKEIHFPHSLGLLYSAFTYYLGFKVNSGEYKVMGLAPYGVPKYTQIIKNKLLDIKDDGSFRLNMKFFDYPFKFRMVNESFCQLFGAPIRVEGQALNQFHMDIAASVQKVLEEVLILITDNLSEEYKISNLCLAGGVALNCVANGKIRERGKFKRIFVQPASGDSGGAIGAALNAYYAHFGHNRKIEKTDAMKGSLLGPFFDQLTIKKTLDEAGATYLEYSEHEMLVKTAKLISEGNSIGWFQGRMEFGPRSLGARSILADPRSESMQKELNLKIKNRESFRPFAPAILSEFTKEWFLMEGESPYMMFVAKVIKERCKVMTDEEGKLFGIDKLNIPRSQIPAVTHVDYTSRVQTVNKDCNLLFYNLLKEFYNIAKIPILLNTSFNVRGEPIVCTPDDALNCFMNTQLDVLVLGNFILHKNQQRSDIKFKVNKYEND